VAILFAIGLTLIVLVAAGALIWFRGDDPDAPPRLEGETLDLGALVTESQDAILAKINMRLAPSVAGRNVMEIVVQPEPGAAFPRIDRVGVTLTPLASGLSSRSVAIDLSGSPRSGARAVTFEGPAMWQADITGDPRGDRLHLATFVFLVPDPNLHGSDAVPEQPSDPQAEALYQRASQQVSELHRVTYFQDLSDGAGLAVRSFHAVNDGYDGSRPGFTYVNPGGFEAIVIDRTAWSRSSRDEPWETRETNAMIPPSEWGGEYTGATGFQLGPVTTTRSGECRNVTFVVPEEERRSIAWYAWCIDEETGHLFRDAMISRAHYMLTDFADFDGDVIVEPPEGAPLVGTPAAEEAEESA
jgi:hypothetical protein